MERRWLLPASCPTPHSPHFFNDGYESFLLALLVFFFLNENSSCSFLPSLPHTLSHEQIHTYMHTLRPLVDPHISGMYIKPFIGV